MRKDHWLGRHAIALGIIGISIAGFALMVFGGKKQSTKPVEEKSWLVRTQTATLGSHQPNLILYGVTESPQNSVLEAAITADVINTPAEEGIIVKKGTLLVELDNREAKLTLQQRQAEADDLQAQISAEKNRYQRDLDALKHEQELESLSERDVMRQERLAKGRYSSQADIDRAKKELNQQRLAITNRQLSIDDHKNRLAQLQAKLDRTIAQQQLAEIDLQRTKISAPFNGRVTKVFVSVGNRVQTGEQLVSLFDIETVEIRAQVPTPYLSLLKIALDDKATLSAHAIDNGNKMPLKLERLAAQVESGSGGVDALFVSSATKALALGRSLEIYMDLPKLDAVFALPMTAIYGKTRIYIVKNQRMQSRKIQRQGIIHHADGDKTVLVTSTELQNGDQVITTQLPNARDGLKVNVAEAS